MSTGQWDINAASYQAMQPRDIPLDAAALDAGLRALGNCTRNGDRICDMEREAAEWLMVNSVACAEQARAALSLRDELAALRVESQEGAEIVGELKAELAEWKDKLGAMTAAHRYATDELAECRAKLAAQIERCGFAELAETQRALERDNALAKLAQAEKERDEALDDAEAAVDAHANCACYERGAVVRIKHLEDALMESSSKRAASQARERELRGKLFDAERDFDVTAGQTTDTLAREACLHYRDKCATALARPVDDSALREMLTEAWRLGRRHGTHSMGAEGDAPPPMEQAISSLLGEKGDQS